MSLKTILIGLSIFRFGGEKSSMEDLPWSSLLTTVAHKTLSVKILPRGVNLCRRNCASII